jgi:hypothetical protein
MWFKGLLLGRQFYTDDCHDSLFEIVLVFVTDDDIQEKGPDLTYALLNLSHLSLIVLVYFVFRSSE